MDKLKQILSPIQTPPEPSGNLKSSIMREVYALRNNTFRETGAPKRARALIGYGLTCVCASIVAFILFFTSAYPVVGNIMQSTREGVIEFSQSSRDLISQSEKLFKYNLKGEKK